MDDMLQQVLAMAEQTSDVVESLTMLATALAIDEGMSMSEAALCKLTEKGTKASSASSAPLDGDALTLSARAIAIFLEKQQSHNLAINFSGTLARQISVIMRKMPRSCYTDAAGNARSSSSSASSVNFKTLTPVDFIEEVLRILHIYGVFKKAFASVTDMPSDTMMLNHCLEWLPHVNRRVFPQLATFCCGRIIVCSVQYTSRRNTHEKLDRSADIFLNTVLKPELSASFQQEILRVEHLMRIAICFSTRAAGVGYGGHDDNTGDDMFGSGGALAYLSGFFGGGEQQQQGGAATSASKKNATNNNNKQATAALTAMNQNVVLNTNFIERFLKIIVDQLHQNPSAPTSAAILTLTLKMITTSLYNDQTILTLILATTSSNNNNNLSVSSLLQQLFKLALIPPLPPQTEGDTTTDAAAAAVQNNDNNNGQHHHHHNNASLRRQRLQLPSMFSSSSSRNSTMSNRRNTGNAADGGGNNGAAGSPTGGSASASSANGGVDDNTILVLSSLSLMLNDFNRSLSKPAAVAPAAAAKAKQPAAAAAASTTTSANNNTKTSIRLEPQLRWTWLSGDAEVDYTDENNASLTDALLGHPTLPSTFVHTPGGRFNMNFEFMAQFNGENKRPRGVSSSYLPRKLKVTTSVTTKQEQDRRLASRPEIVDFFRSLFCCNNNSTNEQDFIAIMSELWSLRGGECKSVVEATFLRLFEVGVWQSLPFFNNNNNKNTSTPALLLLGNILVELLQNSPFAAATVECILNNMKKIKSSSSLFDSWSKFLKSSGFSDILAASVQLPSSSKKNDQDGENDDDDNNIKNDDVPPTATNKDQKKKPAAKTASKPAGGAVSALLEDDAFGLSSQNNNVTPIDPKIASELLTMIGDCIESTSSHTIPQILKRVTELIISNNNNDTNNNDNAENDDSNNNTNNNSPHRREIRTLLSEFAKTVRTGRSQPRKLLKEIVDTQVDHKIFAAFINTDTSLPKTLCRIAAASVFGPQPSTRPSPSQGMSTLSSCASHTIKLYATTATSCVNGHEGCLTKASGNNNKDCCLCKSSSRFSSSDMYSCTKCKTTYCPSCVFGDAVINQNGTGSNNNIPISLLACVGDWLRHTIGGGSIGSNASSSSGLSASVPHMSLIKNTTTPGISLANTITVPVSTPIIGLVTALMTGGGGGNRGGNNNNSAKKPDDVTSLIAGKRKVTQVATQRKQQSDLNLHVSLQTNFIREPVRSIGDSYFNNNNNNNRRRDNNNNNNAQQNSSSFGQQDLIHLTFLQSVCPQALAETFTEELSSWLQISAVDVSLGGPVGLHKKIHDSLPALRFTCPLTTRFEFWRYSAVGAHRRALGMITERELGFGGSVGTEVSARNVVEKYAISVARTNEQQQVVNQQQQQSSTSASKNSNTKKKGGGATPWTAASSSASFSSSASSPSSLIDYFHHHLGEVLIAPIHRRLDLYFRDEVGRGEGPTQEVYSEVARQVSSNPKLWVNDGNTMEKQLPSSSSSSSFTLTGYIPNGGTEKEMYTLGVLAGRALLDGFVVNVPYHELIFSYLSAPPPSSTTLSSNQQQQQQQQQQKSSQSAVRDIILGEVVDPAFYKNVKGLLKMNDDELESTGLELTKKNVVEYVEETLNERFDPIRRSIEEFGRGVQRIVDYNFLKSCFENHELPYVLGGVSPRGASNSHQPIFSAAELDACIVPAHGYTHSCRQIQWLKEALIALSPSEQCDFVEFLTGSRGLPAGGITNLSSVITVVKKQFDDGDTNAKQGTLPSCSTCFLYVKLPPYTSIETMKKRLMTAIQEGRRNFSHS